MNDTPQVLAYADDVNIIGDENEVLREIKTLLLNSNSSKETAATKMVISD